MVDMLTLKRALPNEGDRPERNAKRTSYHYYSSRLVIYYFNSIDRERASIIVSSIEPLDTNKDIPSIIYVH
jgi:hypothetical protein